VNRRDFCSSVIAATTLTTCGLGAAGASRPRDRQAATLMYPYRLIFDSRFPASRLLGAESARHGLAVTAFNGDITALWFHELGPRWAADRAPVAGITTPQALLCLEQLSRDAWMRVAFRAEHADSDARPCVHRVTGQAADVARICAALDGDSDWPARMAAVLAAKSPDDGAGPLQRWVAAGGRWPGDGRTAQLVSWMIAA
jgi:hypothetical protein